MVRMAERKRIPDREEERDSGRGLILRAGLKGSVLASEQGVALAMVLILSAVSLAIMAALISMLLSGTQISGMQKRYKTALDAGVGGADITYQLVAARGNPLDAALTSALSLTVTTPNTCVTLNSDPACTAIGNFTGLATKMNLPTACWSSCDSSLSINPGTTSTYDVSFQLGAGPTYTVYAKIVDTLEGNSGGDEGLVKGGVVSSSGEVTVRSIPYLYTIELNAENAANREERAKLSVLYQY